MTTKPSMRTPRDEIEARVAGRTLTEVVGLTDALDAHASTITALEEQPWNQTEKDRLRVEAEGAVRSQVEELIARQTRTSGRANDEEAASIRAVLANDRPDVAQQLRAQNLASLTINAPLDRVAGLFEDALATKDHATILAVGFAAERRLDDAATPDASKPTSPAKVAALTFKDRFARWQREHPSPRQRLEQLEREKENVAAAIRMSAEFALSLYGIGRAPAARPTLRDLPAVDDDGRVKVGPAFDRILAGRNRTGARR